MLKIEKNNYHEWELLLSVFNKEISENDPEFQRWLEENVENRNLYLTLKGERQDVGISFDKDNAFDNISDILGLNIQKKTPFYRRGLFLSAASVFLVVSVGLCGYFFLKNENAPPPVQYADMEKNIYDPGSKKAILFSGQGETIDLSENFEIENEDGTVITNKSEGIVSFQQNESEKKKVEQHTIYVPKGGEYELLLADGSKVYLNSESRLVFPNYFDGDVRQVELTGEAYFEVENDNKPFIIKTTEMQIRVLGTSFNVNAYRNNASAHTTLVEGSIQIQMANCSEPYRLVPGNKLSIDKTSHEISIINVDTEDYTAWVRGEFVFRNQPLSDIITQLGRWYDFEIEYENPAIQSMRFTGSAEKTRTLDYLLNQIEFVTDIKYKNEGDKIILY